jgi:hypothetical protein
VTNALRYWPIALTLRSLQRVVLVLLAALIMVQTVGVLHRVAHAQQSASVFSHVAPAVAQDDVSVLAAIWGDHSNSAECQLFDQSCPDLLDAPTFASLPLQLVMPWVAVVWQERFALVERFYAARGPPVWH